LSDSRNINTKGVRDYAYLILNQIKEPMHFRDLSSEIAKQFSKKVNVATVHNELIKDPRFILVGRGKYGLKEWGTYSAGTVADVIKEILKSSKKALTKEEIIKEVLSKKDVKEQTVLINLANKSFKRTKDGKYKLA
jgi:DNA-directed RNA polymerase delta subunit